jgi:two-component system chemotaxis response regulator CheB
VTKLEVKEAIEKDELIEGRVIISQGGFHLKIPEFKNKPFVEVFISEKVNHKRPSIDVLMLSVAEHIGRDAIGVLLSGTGEDGVVGLKAMKMSGADTIIIKPETAIISDRLQRAENFASHTHSVAYEDLPDLLMDLVQK